MSFTVIIQYFDTTVTILERKKTRSMNYLNNNFTAQSKMISMSRNPMFEV